MTSASTFPKRLTKIDDLTRPDHSYLAPEDVCYFLGEYTARKGYAFSATNRLILNFKKSLHKHVTAQWKYKGVAIRDAAAAFRATLTGELLNKLTLAPIPPSKAESDPLYDDRLTQMLRAIRRQPPLDVRELIIQHVTMPAAHDQENRPSPEDIATNYAIDQTLLNPRPQMIALVDDVITTGAHFKAAQMVIMQALPRLRVVGLFIARRVPETIDWDEIES